MGWDDYTREAEVGTGGDFPAVADDLYEAMVQDVTEPRDGTDFNGDPCKKFIVKWELLSGDVDEGTTLWQYVTLPPKYITEGVLSEKSNLHKVMTALGFDLTGRFRVDPPSWQGMEARVMVENFPVKDDQGNARKNSDGTAMTRPRITGVKPKRGPKPTAAKAAPKNNPPREPVAAGRRSSSAPFGEEDEE